LQSKAAWENYTEEEKKIQEAKEDYEWAHEEHYPPGNTPVMAGMDNVLLGKEG
jgi:hypothetical protein